MDRRRRYLETKLSKVAADEEWSRLFEPELEAIYARNALVILSIERPSASADERHATDRVISTPKGTVAERIRRAETRERDLTLRYRRRPWGNPEADLVGGYEVDKVLAGPEPRLYLYCWVVGQRLDYVLVDVDVVRAARLIEHALEVGREKTNRDGLSTFTYLTLAELARAGAILAVDLELPVALQTRTPEWYRHRCERQSRAVWRRQLTDAEAELELELWHAVAMRLPYPEGWATRFDRGASCLPS